MGLIRRTGPVQPTRQGRGRGDDGEHAEAVGASTFTVGVPLRAGVDLPSGRSPWDPSQGGRTNGPDDPPPHAGRVPN